MRNQAPPTPSEYIADIQAMLSDSDCSTWDRNFLRSILRLLQKNSTLTEKQIVVLDRILYSGIDGSDQESRTQWIKTYKASYQADAILVAHYHAAQPYYTLMAEDILKDRVPEKKAFFRMFNNKYSQKVLWTAKQPPKFVAGQFVGLKKGFKFTDLTLENGRHPLRVALVENGEHTAYGKLKHHGGVIIGVDDKVLSAAKGAKRYKIVPVGDIEIFYVEERSLILLHAHS